jgi:hypothetical protein
MSDLVIVRYNNDPIMLQYSFWFTASPSLSSSRAIMVDMGVERGLASPISNFLRRFLVYLP